MKKKSNSEKYIDRFGKSVNMKRFVTEKGYCEVCEVIHTTERPKWTCFSNFIREITGASYIKGEVDAEITRKANLIFKELVGY